MFGQKTAAKQEIDIVKIAKDLEPLDFAISNLKMSHLILVNFDSADNFLQERARLMLTGAAKALDAKLKAAGPKTLLLAPKNVQVSEKSAPVFKKTKPDKKQETKTKQK